MTPSSVLPTQAPPGSGLPSVIEQLVAKHPIISIILLPFLWLLTKELFRLLVVSFDFAVVMSVRHAFHKLLRYRLKTVSYPELIEATKQWNQPKAASWKYQGTKDGYHYFNFYDEPWGDKDQYRVLASEFDIADPFPFTTRRRDWRSMPWGPPLRARFVNAQQEQLNE